MLAIGAKRKLRLTSEESSADAWDFGEAVTLETESGPLFALLAPRSGGLLGGTITKSLAPEFQRGNTYDLLGAIKELQRQSSIGRRAILPRWTNPIKADGRRLELWPWIVRFADLGDPSSLEEVDPAAVGIERMTVEVTADPITYSIAARLPWLPGWRGAIDAPGNSNRVRPPVKRLNTRAFWRARS